MRRLGRAGSGAIMFVAASAFTGAAFADVAGEGAPPVPAESGVVAAPAQDRLLLWKADFESAVRAMQAGRYREAEATFARLAATSTSVEQRQAALEYREACAYWGSRELVLVPQQRSLRKPSARELGLRTPDEIAVLYTHAMLWGIGSGLMLSSYREPTNFAEFALPVVAATGVAIGAVAVADAGEPLGYGVGQSIASGMQLGFAEGVVLVAYHQAVASKADEWSGSTTSTILWGAATAGAITGGVVGAGVETTPGRAAFVSSAAMWTGVFAGTMTAAFDGDDGKREQHGAVGAAVGLNAGLLFGAISASPVSPSQRRVRYLDIGGVLGAMGGVGLTASVADSAEDDRPLWGLLGAGTAAGLCIAWFATSSMPEEHRWEEEHGARSSPTLWPVQWRAAVAPAPGGASLQIGASL